MNEEMHMHRSSRLAAVALSLALAVGSFGFGRSAQASCAAMSMADYIHQATVVARGTVLSTGLGSTATFLISSYYKGNEWRTHLSFGRVSTVWMSEDMQWVDGQEYILFLHGQSRGYTTNACDGTRLVSDVSAADLAHLGQAVPAADSAHSTAWPVGTLLVTVAAAIGVGRMRRRRA